VCPLVYCIVRSLTADRAPLGYVAGVLNPIFESLPVWDVLCNIVTNTITIHKDIAAPAPAPSLFPVPPTLNNLGSKSNGSPAYEDEFGRVITSGQQVNATPTASRPDMIVRQDSYDVLFMEDVSTRKLGF
jgi:hypothetical protein